MPVGTYSSSAAAYPTTPIIGVDLTAVSGSASGPEHSLGLIVTTTRGEKFEYVKALSTVSQYDCVAFIFPGSATTVFQNGVAPATIAYSSAYRKIAIAPVAIASGAYAWVQTGGGAASVNLLTACQPKAPLFFTATAGSLDDAVSSQACAIGIIALSSASAGGAAVVQCALADSLSVGWNGGL